MRIEGSFVIGQHRVPCEDATPEKVDLLLGSVDGLANAPLAAAKAAHPAVPYDFAFQVGPLSDWLTASRAVTAPPAPPPRYVLKVGAGTYEAETLPALLWQILTHRLWHFRRGEGWRD